MVVVTDNDENEDKSQWDNDPERVDTVRLGEGCASLHLYLRNEGVGGSTTRSTGLMKETCSWVGEMFCF